MKKVLAMILTPIMIGVFLTLSAHVAAREYQPLVGNTALGPELIDRAAVEPIGTNVVRVMPANPQVPSCLVCITEYMYSGNDGGFVEFTNVSGGLIDMTGWSFDDSHGQPGTTDLSAFGMVADGESVIMTDGASDTIFRSAWHLPSSVKIIANTGHSLGRSDEINLYDDTSTLADHLTYDDQANPGTIQAKDVSGWAYASDLGTNVSNWRLSEMCDLQNTVQSTNGDIGNPGMYSDGLGNAASSITLSSDSPFLNPQQFSDAGCVSGVLNDPTDPASMLGITLTLSDPGYAVAAISSDTSVVPQDGTHLNLSGSGTTRVLKITPAAVGRAVITFRVTNGGPEVATFNLNYGASAASVVPATTRFHTGASDASTAIAVDSRYMLIGNDEDQNIRLYDRFNSGLPVNAFDFTNDLGLTDIDGSGALREVDIEASTVVGNRIYWIGSSSNGGSSFNSRPNRNRLFATDLTRSGANSSLSFVGYYDQLRDDLIQWDQNNGNHYGLAASAAAGKNPELPDGFNIEGFALAPGSTTTAYIAFRAPLVPTGNRTKALIVPVTNLSDLVSGNPAIGPATFGTPIELDLGGRGIRSIERNSNNEYLIVAGPPRSTGGALPNFQLFTWAGGSSTPTPVTAVDLSALNTGGSFEGIVEVPNPIGSQPVQLIVDNGDTPWYGDGVASKLLQPNIQKARSEWVTLGSSTPSDHVTVCGSGCDFMTVQAAINDAGTTNGTRITISEAVHTESGIVVDKNVTIEGRGATQSTILQGSATRGTAANRVLKIQPDTNVTLQYLTIRHGYGYSGGGVSNEGTLTITHSTIANNDADTYGGGIENASGILHLVNTTISGNTAAGDSVSHGGGGLDLYGDGTVTIDYSTIVNNDAPNVTDRDGIWLEYGSLSIRNSIVSGNSSTNCTIESGSTFTPSGENIADDASCTGFSQLNTDPKLDTLKDNNGPGPTHALLAGSPALDAISVPCGVATDERGVSRPQGVGCDIGAFELAGSTAHTAYLPIIGNNYAASLPNFSHVFLIVMENKERGQIVGNASAPYINSLRNTYAEAANYYGIRHPSLPNYLTLTSGHTFGISTDCNDCFQNAPNIVTQLEAAGRSWKSYQESMPSPCYIGDSPDLLYRQKHDPFIYYDDVRLDSTRCNKIVPFTEFATDLAANTVPDYVWITPNMCNDTHDCSIATGDNWLSTVVPQILASPAWQNNDVLFITFDEGTSTNGCCGFDPGGGQVVTLVISPRARQDGFASNVAYNHYSLLRTIEQAWGLPYLGHAGDATIQSMTDFFQPTP